MQWSDIECIVKDRFKQATAAGTPFIYDGEPGLDNFLSDIAEHQPCVWHGPRGLYHSLWQDGVKKKDSQADIDKLKYLIGIELPQGDYALIKDEDKQRVEEQYQSTNLCWPPGRGSSNPQAPALQMTLTGICQRSIR